MTTLRPELEALAQFTVQVFTLGMDDLTDQRVAEARIRRLPTEERRAVQQRIREIRTANDTR